MHAKHHPKKRPAAKAGPGPDLLHPGPSADLPAPAPAPTPMAAIAPPPPAADAPPPTIAVGQTRDQVVAGFGQPTRKAQLSSTKEIYFYKDMKVTFTAGKVSNVE